MSSRSKIGWLLAPLVSLGACNALLGVEDVHLRDDGTGAVGDGDPSGGSDSAQGGKSNAAGSATTEAGATNGGVPGGAGETAVGGSGSAGEATGGTGSAGEATGGAGGEPMGGAGGAPDVPDSPCPVLGEQKAVPGPLTLVQFVPHEISRGRLNVSADGKNAYATSWGSITQHFTRDPATGKLTPKSTASVYNGESAVLSPSSRTLFVSGTNGLQFYKIPLAVDGSIADTNANNPPSFVSSLDALPVGDSTILIPAGSSIRWIKNDVYDATNRVAGTYDGVRGLSRSGEYVYWSEYANDIQFPNAATKIGRAHFECDGTLGPREAFATGYSPFDVAADQKTGFVYVPHRAESKPTKPGWIDVVDLSTCKNDFSTCTPVKKVTAADIPGLLDPTGIRVSTDGSTLFVSNGDSSKGSTFMVLSLANPKAPELLQNFEEDEEYDGVKLATNIWAWHMDFFDGYLYVPMEFGKGIAVFKSKK